MKRSCVPSGARWMQSGDLFGVVAVPIDEAEALRHGEVHLVGGNGELAADGAPDLDVDLRSVERRFVRHLDVVDARAVEDIAHHVLGLLPQLRLVDVLLARAFRGRAC